MRVEFTNKIVLRLRLLVGKYSEGILLVALQWLGIEVESDNGFILDSLVVVASKIRESGVLEGMLESSFELVELGGLPRVTRRQPSTV